MALDSLAGIMRGPSQTISMISLPPTEPEVPAMQVAAGMAVGGNSIEAKMAAGWLGAMVFALAGFYLWTHQHQL